MNFLKRERQLMRKFVKDVGVAKIILTTLFILVIVILIEAFASYNIYMLKETAEGIPFLRELFSAVAIMVAAFTVIANIVFRGGRTKADREFHYYFRTRPLLLFSTTAILGDLFAVFLIGGRTSFPYVVFFTSLIALNLFAIGFAIHCTEKAMERAA
jgi:hypothetical protein